jgi:DNA polymerase-3 subunit gamma/tau
VGAEVAPPPSPSQGAATAAPAAAPETGAAPAPEATASLPVSFEAAVKMLDDAREGILAAELRTQVHLVRYAPGRIEFRPSDSAESTLASRLGGTLKRLTGARWAISLSSADGAPTLSDQTQSLAEAAKREAAAHPLVKAALDAFPGAKITEVRAGAAMAEDGPVADPDQEMQEDQQ